MSAAVAVALNDGEFETKSGRIRNIVPKFLTLKIKKSSFCLNLAHKPKDSDRDAETWISTPHQDISEIDRKLDRSSFFAITALGKRKPPTRRKSSLLEIDPSASEEHGIEDQISDSKISTYPLPARSLFSAHEEVIAAFSAGQRRLEQKMSAQQRRASIAEAQKEREAHMEILEQHFGRRFLRRAMTIVEDEVVEEHHHHMEEYFSKYVPPTQVVDIQAPFCEKIGTQDLVNYYKDQQLIKNIHAETFTTTASIEGSPLCFDDAEPVVAAEEDDDAFYIEFESTHGSSDTFLRHAEFSLGARSTTEDVETVF